MSTFGDAEPGMAFMSLGAYWQLRKHFDSHLKLPRKMKKRYLGTRDRRRRMFAAAHKTDIAQFGPIDIELEQIEIKNFEEVYCAFN